MIGRTELAYFPLGLTVPLLPAHLPWTAMPRALRGGTRQITRASASWTAHRCCRRMRVQQIPRWAQRPSKGKKDNSEDWHRRPCRCRAGPVPRPTMAPTAGRKRLGQERPVSTRARSHLQHSRISCGQGRARSRSCAGKVITSPKTTGGCSLFISENSYDQSSCRSTTVARIVANISPTAQLSCPAAFQGPPRFGAPCQLSRCCAGDFSKIVTERSPDRTRGDRAEPMVDLVLRTRWRTLTSRASRCARRWAATEK